MNTGFEVYTLDTAPAESQEILKPFKEQKRMFANLLGVLAGSPVTLKAYLSLAKLFRQSSLTRAERHVVFLTASFENTCTYCMAAHSTAARNKLPKEQIEALREGRPLSDKKLEALRQLTSALVQKRGLVTAQDIDAFLKAGYTHQQILEILVGLAMKILTAYTDHMAGIPLDKAFAAQKWIPPSGQQPGCCCS